MSLGASAQAGVLYDGYGNTVGAGGVNYLDGTTLSPTGPYAAAASQPVGVAAGGGGVFAAYDDHHVIRYDAAAAQTAQVNTGPFFTPGLMTYGDDTLFVSFTNTAMATGIDFWDPTTLAETGKTFYLPEAISGLAFGDDSLFVSYSHHLARYDLTGALLGSIYTGPYFDPGALAFGDGKLFVAFTQPTSGATGIDWLDGDLNSLGPLVYTSELAHGLAFGDGTLFGSFEHSIATWDGAGTAGTSTFTGPYYFPGQLAYAAEGAMGGVPEPATWALMIAGFGLMGASLRRRRPTAAA